MSRQRVLILDDDQMMLKSLSLILRADFDISEATSVSRAKSIASSERVDLAIVDLNLEGQSESGLDFIKWISRECPKIAMIVFSGDADTDRVVSAAQRKDISAFIVKGKMTPSSLKTEVQRVLSQKAATSAELSKIGLITKSSALLAELAKIDRMASQGAGRPILILGESGTGKELVARYIANAFRKRLFRENVTNFPKDLADSILFGAKKGAYTGSVADRVGLITAASEDVLFLDEIGDCELAVQAKLLRVIQDKELTPIGENRTIKVNTQFVFATHRDLSDRVKEGLFREDLYFRIRVLEIRIPSLRERPEDIEPIVQSFLSKMPNDVAIRLTDCAYAALREYAWPGNIRELQNLIDRLTVTSNSKTINGNDIKAALHSNTGEQTKISDEQIEKNKLTHAIISFKGHRQKIAQHLGWHRNTVSRKIQSHRLDGLFFSAGGRPRNVSETDAG